MHLAFQYAKEFGLSFQDVAEGQDYHPDGKITERYAKLADWLIFYRNQRECLAGLNIKIEDVPLHIKENKHEFYSYVQELIDQRREGKDPKKENDILKMFNEDNK